MSVKVKKNEIKLTRGDTMRLKVVIKKDGVEYTPQEGDVVRFALEHDTLNSTGTEYTDPEPLILKGVPIDTMILMLNPADTKDLGFGRYVYDLEITFADGTVDTFITAMPFNLTEEVH